MPDALPDDSLLRMENWFYRDSFMNVIDEIVDQVSQNRTGCWDYGWPYPVTWS